MYLHIPKWVSLLLYMVYDLFILHIIHNSIHTPISKTLVMFTSLRRKIEEKSELLNCKYYRGGLKLKWACVHMILFLVIVHKYYIPPNVNIRTEVQEKSYYLYKNMYKYVCVRLST